MSERRAEENLATVLSTEIDERESCGAPTTASSGVQTSGHDPRVPQDAKSASQESRALKSGDPVDVSSTLAMAMSGWKMPPLP